MFKRLSISRSIPFLLVLLVGLANAQITLPITEADVTGVTTMIGWFAAAAATAMVIAFMLSKVGKVSNRG